jgi:hypothetical protein
MPDLATMELELRNVRREVRNLQVIQMRPWLSEEKRKFLNDLERSARAEVKLRLKAIEHHQGQIPTRRYLMTPEQHRRAAQDLRQHNPNSRAAVLHEAAAKMQESKRN